MENLLGSFFPFLVVGLVGVAIVGGAWYSGYKRRKDLAFFCQNNGFEYDEEASSLTMFSAYDSFPREAPPHFYSDSSGFGALGAGKNQGEGEAQGISAGDVSNTPIGPGSAPNNPAAPSAADVYAGDPIYKKSGFFSVLLAGTSSPLDQTGLKIFNTGHSRRASNLVMVPFRKGKLFFFDYKYTTGGGKHSQTHVFTLALVKSPSSLPDFYLRPENFGDKIADFVGFSDIDIPGYDDFSKSYYLKSSSPQEVLSFFNNQRITAFQGSPGWNVYARGRYLVAFKRRGRLSVRDYPTYIEEVKTLLNSLNLE